MTRAARTSIQLEIWVPAIDVFRLNHSMAFLPDRPPHLGGLPRFQHPTISPISQSRSVTVAAMATHPGHTQKAAKVSLDGSCRCICVAVLCRAVLERSPCSLLFGRTRPSMRPVGALPVCRANDPRSLSHVTGGDALQASDAVPFDEMAKAGFQLSALRWAMREGNCLRRLKTLPRDRKDWYD